MTEGTTPTRGATLRKAYGMAMTRLRESRMDEFRDLYAAAAKELGVEYTPPLTDAEKDEAAFAELLERRPELAEKYGLKGAGG